VVALGALRVVARGALLVVALGALRDVVDLGALRVVALGALRDVVDLGVLLVVALGALRDVVDLGVLRGAAWGDRLGLLLLTVPRLGARAEGVVLPLARFPWTLADGRAREVADPALGAVEGLADGFRTVPPRLFTVGVRAVPPLVVPWLRTDGVPCALPAMRSEGLRAEGCATRPCAPAGALFPLGLTVPATPFLPPVGWATPTRPDLD